MNIVKVANLVLIVGLAWSASDFQLFAQTDEQASKQVWAAIESGVETESQFRVVADFIKASDEDEKWRKIPWVPSLWEGLLIAEKKNKPMFIWAMKGSQRRLLRTLQDQRCKKRLVPEVFASLELRLMAAIPTESKNTQHQTAQASGFCWNGPLACVSCSYCGETGAVQLKEPLKPRAVTSSSVAH